MKIILDTNVLLVCISKKSSLHWIWQSLRAQKFTLCVTTDILVEYEEIIGQHMGIETAEFTLSTIDNLPNVELATRWYRFLLLGDMDDNKFVDCAIAINANFIVTHDKDFNILKSIPFPIIPVIDTNEFKKLLDL